MIFQYTYNHVLDGLKVESRRIVKDNEKLVLQHNKTPEVHILRSDGRWMVKWKVGRTYAVTPGRGKSSVGRIKLLGIREEPIQNMTEENAMREGCVDLRIFISLWNKIHLVLDKRFEANPKVFVLTFEAVEDYRSKHARNFTI